MIYFKLNGVITKLNNFSSQPVAELKTDYLAYTRRELLAMVFFSFHRLSAVVRRSVFGLDWSGQNADKPVHKGLCN